MCAERYIGSIPTYVCLAIEQRIDISKFRFVHYKSFYVYIVGSVWHLNEFPVASEVKQFHMWELDLT